MQVGQPRTITTQEQQQALDSPPSGLTNGHCLADATIQQHVLHPYARTSALARYQHYAAALGRDLALFLLHHGSTSLAAAVRLSYNIVRLVVVNVHRWCRRSQLPKAAAALLGKTLASLLSVLQRYITRPLGRLLTQLVWFQVKLTTDDDTDDGVRLSARLNSCLSLFFGTVRLRSHSCLQLARPSRQPVLVPEFSLSSPAPSPRRQAAALIQQQEQQGDWKLLRAASTPTPSSSPRRQHTAAGGISSSRQRTARSGPVNHGCQSPLDPFVSGLWADLPGAQRASLAQALGCRQQPRQGLTAMSSGTDSEVHVLCSSELKAAIMAFLQAHSRHSGSEFVLLRNFNTSSPPTPTLELSDAAAATAAEPATGNAAAASQTLPDHGPAVQAERGDSGVEAVPAAIAAQSGKEVPAVVGFDAAGADAKTGAGVNGKTSSQQRSAQILAVAAEGSSSEDGSSTGGSRSAGGRRFQEGSLASAPVSRDGGRRGGHDPHGTSQYLRQRLQQEAGVTDPQVPLHALSQHEQRRHVLGQETPPGPQAWQQGGHQEDVRHQATDQQQDDGDDAAADDSAQASQSAMKGGALCSPAKSPRGGLNPVPWAGQSKPWLAGHRQDTRRSPQKQPPYAAAAAAAAVAEASRQQLRASGAPCLPQRGLLSAASVDSAAAAASSTTSPGSQDESGGCEQRVLFESAASKFRLLAASAAAGDSDRDGDPCSRPLMSFSRRTMSSPPSGVSSSCSGKAADASSRLSQQQQYAQLYPPGSRSFEALSLRKSNANNAIGTPACHARHTASLPRKKLPAAPFSLSASLPLPLDTMQMTQP